MAAIETFNHIPVGTVTSGGTTTSDTAWTVTVTAAFPAASGTVKFHVCDPAASTELILVTASPGGIGAGQSWTVTRGADGTPAVAHAGGFTIYQVVSASWLNSAVVAGNPLTTAGDLLYENATPALARLPVGTAGQALTVSTAGLPAWAGGVAGWININTVYGAAPSASQSANVTALQNALNAAVSNGGGVVYIPFTGTGNYQFNTGVSINLNGTYVAIVCDVGVQLSYYGSGDFLRMYDSSTYSGRAFRHGAGIYGFPVIDGTNSSASAASAGLHIGDIFGLMLQVNVQNFANFAGSIGVHFDNQSYWTEQMYGIIYAQNCIAHVVFDVSGSTTSTGSYDRLNLAVYINQVTASNDGVVLQNGAALADGALSIRGNFNSSASALTSCVLRVTGTSPAGHPDAGLFSRFTVCHIDVGVECPSGAHAPTTIICNNASNTFVACYGTMDFDLAGANFTPASGATINALYTFNGLIVGDTGLATVMGYPDGYLWNIPGGVALGNYVGPVALSNGSTISTAAVGKVPVSSTGAVTGIIMAVGVNDGQECVINNTTGFTVTFAAAGTSNVSGGTAVFVAPNASMLFIWENNSSLWFPIPAPWYVSSGQATTTDPVLLPAGTATAAPLNFASGTNLTSAAAGATEYDGASVYFTNETTSGRGLIPVEQKFRLTATGSNITTIANYFGTTSNISLVANAEYEIEIDCWFLKNTAGAVTWTFTNSAAPTSMNLAYKLSPATGIVTTAANTALFGEQYNITATAPTVVSASLTTAVNHHHQFWIRLINGSGTSLKIQATAGAGSITPGINSAWKCRRVPAANVGTFSA